MLSRVVMGSIGRSVMGFYGDGNDGLLIKSVLQQEGCARGILAAGWHAPSYAHTIEDVEETLGVYDQAFAIIAEGLAAEDLSDRLHGRMVEPVFRKP